ncbi:kinase-like protein [Tuber magnatum]|uniref:non-specific serine/threonine protein kinase n=1 Tax=Tuber magnatum TaxID=42249 RepID=A0A317STS5_9PEZI|nr:kinase-like protein [Tuber magnatum]
MSDNQRPQIVGNFSGNVNSMNFVNAGDAVQDFWHPLMAGSTFPDMMKGARFHPKFLITTQFELYIDPPIGRTDTAETPKAKQNQPTQHHAQTRSDAPSPTQFQSGKLGANNVIGGNPPFFTGGTIFGEPRDKAPEPASRETEVYGTPVREPPAWRLNYEIGSGSFGTVFLEKVQTRGMESPELWAVKRISKAIPNFPAKRYQAEIKNLQELSKSDPEWFVKFNASYQDAHYVYIAMEYIPIGDISKTFVKGYRWKESDTKVAIEQLLRGLVVMHKEGITHRDLKPENIFLCIPDRRSRALRVKIGDFGTSKRIPLSSASTYLKTTTGTEGYMAPEMDDTERAEEPKTNRVDIWSLGCILYRMVAGKPLFANRREVWRYSMQAVSPPPAVEKIGFSVSCVNFLHRVLQPNEKDRPSAEECLGMAWITSEAPGSEYSISQSLYTRLSKLKLEAPDVYSLSEAVANSAGSGSPARGLSTVVTPMTGPTASTLRTAKTFGPARAAVFP